MRLPFPKNLHHWVALGILAPIVTVTVALLISRFFPWSPLNCRHEDVDIHTGRVRHTQYLLFCQIGDRTEDTWLSRASSKANGTPDWRRVNTFSPGVSHSPHYHFHGAIHQIRTLERADTIVPFDSNARHKVADTLLTLWQEGDSYSEADEFVEKVAQTALDLYDKGASVFGASDVPAQ